MEDAGRHGALRLGETGKMILKGQAEFHYRQPTEKFRPPKVQAGPVADVDQALLSQLKGIAPALGKTGRQTRLRDLCRSHPHRHGRSAPTNQRRDAERQWCRPCKVGKVWDGVFGGLSGGHTLNRK